MWNTIPSTIITAPSTMIPKSIAPNDIRFAQTPNCFIIINANNRDKGITEAVINPPRKLPKRSTKTNITMSDPSIRFFSTVLVVRAIRSLLLKKVSIYTPSGKDFCISLIRASTFLTTLLGLCPFSIKICPPTDS